MKFVVQQISQRIASIAIQRAKTRQSQEVQSVPKNIAAQNSSKPPSLPKFIVIQPQKIMVERSQRIKDSKGLRQGINNIFKYQRQK